MWIYEHSKNAPAVIVAPGTGSHAGNYSQFCETLSDRGYNVLPSDLMGHGKSGGERGVFSMHELLENVSTVVSYAESNYGCADNMMLAKQQFRIDQFSPKTGPNDSLSYELHAML